MSVMAEFTCRHKCRSTSTLPIPSRGQQPAGSTGQHSVWNHLLLAWRIIVKSCQFKAHFESHPERLSEGLPTWNLASPLGLLATNNEKHCSPSQSSLNGGRISVQLVCLLQCIKSTRSPIRKCCKSFPQAGFNSLSWHLFECSAHQSFASHVFAFFVVQVDSRCCRNSLGMSCIRRR